MLAGRVAAIWAFLTRESVVIPVRDRKRESGSDVSEVESMWRVDREERLVKDDGSAPAGRNNISLIGCLR
jgi:hypothetical protein